MNSLIPHVPPPSLGHLVHLDFTWQGPRRGRVLGEFGKGILADEVPQPLRPKAWLLVWQRVSISWELVRNAVSGAPGWHSH